MHDAKTTRRQLSSVKKNRLIGAVLGGQSVARAARLFDIKDSTARSIMKKYYETGDAENRPRSGRPPKLTEYDRRHIIRTAKKERRTPFAEIGNQLGLRVGETTIRRVLNAVGFHRRVARKVPFLSKLHMHAQLSIPNEYTV